MTVLSDRQIIEFARNGMIEPFSEVQIGRAQGVLSSGPSSYGYDIRVGSTFKTPINSAQVLDPKTVTEAQYRSFISTDPVTLWPGQFLLGHSVEYFRIPRDLLVISTNKSTYARFGLDFSIVTVLEPEWEGTLTIEIANHGGNPVRFYPGEGCMQLIFLKGDESCETSYADRKGKYNFQKGVTISRVSQ